jgi:hypothetical protein
MQADAAHEGWAARWRENVMRLPRCGCARGDERRGQEVGWWGAPWRCETEVGKGLTDSRLDGRWGDLYVTEAESGTLRFP